MSKKYEVIWSEAAENDLKQIIRYIAEESPSQALKILRKIKQRASTLYSFPQRGRVIPELRDQGIMQYRELILPPWRIQYRIAQMNVYILSVLDSRRNIEDALLQRLTNSII